MKILYYLFRSIINLKTKYRILILILLDAILFYISIKLGLFLFSENTKEIFDYQIIIFILFFGLPFYYLTGQYKSISSYFSSNFLYKIVIRNSFSLFILFIAFNFLFNYFIDGKSLFGIWLILNSNISIYRIIIRDLLSNINKSNNQKVNVAIFGADKKNAQFAAYLRLHELYNLVAFIDDRKQFKNRNILGVPIKSSSNLTSTYIKKLLVIPENLSIKQKTNLYELINKNKIEVVKLPSLSQLISKKINLNHLEPFEIHDLLGRESVEPISEYLFPNIKNKVVCVTGAGGSIGSELCRQVMQLNPKKLIMIDNGEENLYKIDKEIRDTYPKECVDSALTSCLDQVNLEKIFSESKIDTVFHAAAYKHVPLVETNPIQGISNNVIGTKNVCQVSDHYGVSNFILISTDKAVRPTNVMGASKRLAELIVQAYSDIQKNKKENIVIFSIVRFGNVLGSSGSVVPLFKKQIAKGGPITITHPNIVRYFMTIQEATLLVIQSSVFAKGGEVFVLDMGEPILIYDLAEKMINLSGLKVRNTLNPNGDIEIISTGLRPGEKLYEELLIGEDSSPTDHKLIFKAKEYYIDSTYLFQRVKELEKLVKKHDLVNSLKILKNLVKEWKNDLLLNNLFN